MSLYVKTNYLLVGDNSEARAKEWMATRPSLKLFRSCGWCVELLEYTNRLRASGQPELPRFPDVLVAYCSVPDMDYGFVDFGVAAHGLALMDRVEEPAPLQTFILNDTVLLEGPSGLSVPLKRYEADGLSRAIYDRTDYETKTCSWFATTGKLVYRTEGVVAECALDERSQQVIRFKLASLLDNAGYSDQPLSQPDEQFMKELASLGKTDDAHGKRPASDSHSWVRKAALLDRLQGAGVSRLSVEYDGSDDLGGVEGITAVGTDGAAMEVPLELQDSIKEAHP